jgi:tetratricopeptide (TPR) repeat protein
MLARTIEIVMIGNERAGMLSLKGIMFFLACALLVQTAVAADPQSIYQESATALYNLDFSTAQHGYETLTQDYPENPDYWNALASSVWLKIIYDQQKLNIESFSGPASFGTRDSKDAVNPDEEKRLRDTVAMAMAKAGTILKKNPNDVHALYALGISNATLASFESTIKRSYFAAHGKAKTARDLHQRVLNLDPTFDDARMSIGTYDYVIGVLPGFLRFLLAPFGIRSEGKEAGIRQLETAAAKGKMNSTDARMVLTVVYNREKKYDEALRLINELHAKYPRNFLFEMAKAAVYEKMKQGDQAVRVYEEVLEKVQRKQDGYDRLRAAKVYYSLGTSNVNRYQFEKAAEDFEHVVSGEDSSPNEKAGAYLWLGKIFDSRKERMKALEQYDALLKLDCDPELKEEAQRYKRRPYGQ